MNHADREALAGAREVLENPGLAVRLTDLLGRPVEAAVAALPAAASRQIRLATSAALQRALSVALRTLDGDPDPPADWLHRLAAGAAGAGGGAFGLAGLAVELPLSTGLMLRAIADHARAQGEDLSQPAARLECLAVFAYGSPRAADDAADAGYFAARAALARSVSEAAEWIAAKGVARAASDRGAPALARLVTAVASRFSVAVSEKAAAQLVPVVGAAGGAALNLVFMNHYQRTAWGHFTVRRLSRTYGEEAVRAAWGPPSPPRRRGLRSRR
ncbi:MAG TPA: EcsC family protein [Anaeromyxobacteraceae bacterium]|nr:EcsC family protein [Anaeromyxobacteraceae bacterium]